jgi:hypothetical protein
MANNMRRCNPLDFLELLRLARNDNLAVLNERLHQQYDGYPPCQQYQYDDLERETFDNESDIG